MDDDPSICDFVRVVAEGVGFNVISTSDPREFPNLFSTKLDVIVFELNMPGIDGIELIRFLSENRREAAVLLISGHDPRVLRAANEIAAGQGLRVVGSMRKPLEAHSLGDLLAGFSVQVPPYPEEGTAELPSIDELRDAIATEELTVFYQPKIDFSSRSLVGFEALVRWPHKTKGDLPPHMFIPFAEKNLLIDDLTNLVISQVIRDFERWDAIGTKPKISINISALSLETWSSRNSFLNACVTTA